MRNVNLKTVLIAVFFSVTSLLSVAAQVSFHDGKHLFVGPKPSHWDLVGPDLNVIVGQQWGIEIYESGFNIWRLYSIFRTFDIPLPFYWIYENSNNIFLHIYKHIKINLL